MSAPGERHRRGTRSPPPRHDQTSYVPVQRPWCPYWYRWRYLLSFGIVGPTRPDAFHSQETRMWDDAHGSNACVTGRLLLTGD